MSGWNRGIAARKVGNRGPPRPAILIVCEGEKTEPNYFKSWRITSVRVEVFGTGKNTKSLVDEAIAKKDDFEPDQCWCVFDRDSFLAEQVNTACQKARDHGCQLAFSNECFELWYLLHFNFIDAALSRERFPEMLKEQLGHPYKKNSEDIYAELRDKQATAIRNAEKLSKRYQPHNPAKHNPFTSVHLLVIELNKYLPTQTVAVGA